MIVAKELIRILIFDSKSSIWPSRSNMTSEAKVNNFGIVNNHKENIYRGLED